MNPEAYKPIRSWRDKFRSKPLIGPRGKVLSNPVRPSLTARSLAMTNNFQKHFGLIHLASLRFLKHFLEKKSPLSLFISPFIFSLLFRPVSSLVLLILSSCLLSSLLSISSCLLSSSLFFSCLLSLSLSLSLFLSVSVCLCLCVCLRVVLCVVSCVVLCCVVCVVWCVARLGTQKTPPCVDSKRPRVYRHHARMCARGAGTHGDVLNLPTETFFHR